MKLGDGISRYINLLRPSYYTPLVWLKSQQQTKQMLCRGSLVYKAAAVWLLTIINHTPPVKIARYLQRRLAL